MQSFSRNVAPRVSRRGAFTLVELLVVIGIIGLLLSILLPSLGKAQQQARLTKCLSNIRTLGQAVVMYCNDNKSKMPFINWGPNGDTGKDNVEAGWLYRMKVPVSLPLVYQNTGSLWPYLKNAEVYRCPGHPLEECPSAESVATKGAMTDRFTSYLINGAANGYDQAGGAKPPFYPITKFKPIHVMFWEADERGTAWNDGSSWAYESFDSGLKYAEGLARRHGRHSTLCFMDSHAEIIPHKDLALIANENKRNMFNCSPNPESTNGR